MATVCFVPLCGNSLIDCPEKLFFIVPNAAVDETLLWFSAVGVDLTEWTKQRETEGKPLTAYCCQDHFDLAEDSLNLSNLNAFNGGVVEANLLKPEVVPHIFGPSAEVQVLATGVGDDSEMVDPLAIETEEFGSGTLLESTHIVNIKKEVNSTREDVSLLKTDVGRNQRRAYIKVPAIRIKNPDELISDKAPIKIPVAKEKKKEGRPHTFKQCIVPDCPSSTDNRTEDDFICVPMTVIRKKAWMDAINRKWTSDVAKGIQHCCVDHFNDTDLENYNQNVAQGGYVTKRRARDGVLPSLKIPGKDPPDTNDGNSAKRKPAPKSVLEARKRKLVSGYSCRKDVVDKSKYRSLKLCQICFELFESEASYALHIKFPCIQNRPNVSPKRCRVCKLNCSSLADLSAHVESVHKYICVGCDESFADIQALRLHIEAGCGSDETFDTVNGTEVKKSRVSSNSGEGPAAPTYKSGSDVEFVAEEKLGATIKERVSEEEDASTTTTPNSERKSLRVHRRTSVKLSDKNFKTRISSDSSASEDSASDGKVGHGRNDHGTSSDEDWRNSSWKKGTVKRRRRGRPALLRRKRRIEENDPDYSPNSRGSDSDPDDPDSSKDSGSSIKSGIATCWKCKRRFKNLPALKVHMQISPGCQMDSKQSSAALRVQCKSCSVYFTSSLGLGLHLKRSKTCMKDNPGAILPGVIPSNNSEKNDELNKDEPKVFMCSKCKATFTSVWGLRTHERNSTTCKPDKPYAIPVPVDKSEAERLKKERSLLISKQQVEKEPTILYSPRIQEGDTTQFKCKNCQAIFTSVWGLRTHERISLKCGTRTQKDDVKKTAEKSSVIVYPTGATSKAADTDCVCKHCKAKFNSYRGYSAHLRLSSTCSGGYKAINKTQTLQCPPKSQKDRDSGAYACPMCHNSFIGTLEFAIHFSEHGNLVKSHGKYNCFVCQKKFSDISSLYRHTYCDHIGEWFCPICSFNFNSFKLFFEHVNGQHNNGLDAEKLTQCDHCLRSFTTIDCLDRHSMICPSPPKPTLSCYICAKKFLKKLHIKNHLKFCHPNLAVDDKYCYQCSKCPRLFSSEKDLAEHSKDDCIKAEELVKCDLCSSSFLGRMYLKKHIKLYHAEVSPPEETDDVESSANNVDSVVTVKEEFTFVEIKEEPNGMEPENVGLEFEDGNGQ